MEGTVLHPIDFPWVLGIFSNGPAAIGYLGQSIREDDLAAVLFGQILIEVGMKQFQVGKVCLWIWKEGQWFGYRVKGVIDFKAGMIVCQMCRCGLTKLQSHLSINVNNRSSYIGGGLSWLVWNIKVMGR